MNPSPDPGKFLGECQVIRLSLPEHRDLASKLKGQTMLATVANCFHFVRDEIAHSSDFQRNPVTCSADEVLQHRTGFCYAKSHLLCALLRHNGAPSGLCYQRLSVDGQGAPYCLHGLNAVFLEDYGWYRLDARGNRSDVDAQFAPPSEQLAFPTNMKEEYDLPGIFVSPMENVLAVLAKHTTWEQVVANLPDVETDRQDVDSAT